MMPEAPENTGGYEYPLDSQMETVIDVYEDDRRQYLEKVADSIGEEGRKALKQVEEASRLLLRVAGSLAAAEELPQFRHILRQAMESEDIPDQLRDLLRLACETVLVEAGRSACTMVRTAKDRLLDVRDDHASGRVSCSM